MPKHSSNYTRLVSEQNRKKRRTQGMGKEVKITPAKRRRQELERMRRSAIKRIKEEKEQEFQKDLDGFILEEFRKRRAMLLGQISRRMKCEDDKNYILSLLETYEDEKTVVGLIEELLELFSVMKDSLKIKRKFIQVHYSEESQAATPGGPEGSEIVYQNYILGRQSIDEEAMLEFFDFVAKTNLYAKEIKKGSRRYEQIREIIVKYRTDEILEEINQTHKSLEEIFKKNENLRFVSDYFFKHRKIFDIERILPEMDSLVFDPILDRGLEVENFSYDEYMISREEEEIPPSPEDMDSEFLRSFRDNVVLEEADLDSHEVRFDVLDI